MYLDRGWKTFARIHSLMEGFTLHFRLMEGDLLSVKVFGCFGTRAKCCVDSSSDSEGSSSSESDEEGSDSDDEGSLNGLQGNHGGSWRSPGKPCRGALQLPVHEFGILGYPYSSTPTLSDCVFCLAS